MRFKAANSGSTGRAVSRIRIMHVIRSLGTGGTEGGLRKLLIGLDPDIFEQTVCTVLQAPPVEPQSGARTLSLTLPPGTGGLLLPRFMQVFLRERPHIVHSRNWGTIEAVPAARLARVPVVVHSEHGLDVHTIKQQLWRRRVFRRACFRWSDRAFTVSQGLKDYYVQHLGRAAERMQVISNGVDTEHFRPDRQARESVRRQLDIGADVLVVGTVGRLDPVKDHRTLFRAAEMAIVKGARIRLVIVGDGEERARLEADIRSRPALREFTVFAGEQQDPAPWLNSFDVFALPSLAEGMSNTLLEAMATGVAPVASLVGGNAEVIVEGQSGLLFPAGDAGALNGCLTKLAFDASLRHQMGLEARLRVERYFSLQAMLRNYAQLYGDTLRGKGVMAGGAVQATRSEPDNYLRVEVEQTAGKSE